MNEFTQEVRSSFDKNKELLSPSDPTENVLNSPPTKMLTQEGFRCLKEDFDMANLFNGIDKPSPGPGLENNQMKTQETGNGQELDSLGQEEISREEISFLTTKMKTARVTKQNHQDEINNLKQALQEVSSQMLQYQEFYENSSDMCMFISPDLLIIKEFNPATVKQLGYPEGELKGVPLNMFVAPEDRPLIRSFILSLFSKNKSSIMVQFIGKNKNRLPLALSGRIVRDGDTILSVLISAKKVTYSENQF